MNELPDFFGGANREPDGLVLVGVVGVDFEDQSSGRSVFEDRASILGRVEDGIVVIDVVNDDVEGGFGDLLKDMLLFDVHLLKLGVSLHD